MPGWRGSLLNGGEYLASKLTAQLFEQLRIGYRAIARCQGLAVEDLLAVQQDLERAALTAWSEGNRYFGVPAPGDFSRQTDGLPEIASTDAVTDLEPGLPFSHVEPPVRDNASHSSILSAGARPSQPGPHPGPSARRTTRRADLTTAARKARVP